MSTSTENTFRRNPERAQTTPLPSRPRPMSDQAPTSLPGDSSIEPASRPVRKFSAAPAAFAPSTPSMPGGPGMGIRRHTLALAARPLRSSPLAGPAIAAGSNTDDGSSITGTPIRKSKRAARQRASEDGNERKEEKKGTWKKIKSSPSISSLTSLVSGGHSKSTAADLPLVPTTPPRRTSVLPEESPPSPPSSMSSRRSTLSPSLFESSVGHASYSTVASSDAGEKDLPLSPDVSPSKPRRGSLSKRLSISIQSLPGFGKKLKDEDVPPVPFLSPSPQKTDGGITGSVYFPMEVHNTPIRKTLPPLEFTQMERSSWPELESDSDDAPASSASSGSSSSSAPAPIEVPTSPTSSVFTLQELSAIHFPGSSPHSFPTSPYSTPPTSPNLGASFGDAIGSITGRISPPKSPFLNPGTPRALHTNADGIPLAHALPSPSTDAFPATVSGGSLFPVTYTPSGASCSPPLSLPSPTTSQGYAYGGSVSATTGGFKYPERPSQRPTSFVRANSSPSISKMATQRGVRPSLLRPKMGEPVPPMVGNRPTTAPSASSGDAAANISGGMVGSWMTDSVYGTTPKFSRLSLAASGVTLPLTVKQHKRISRVSSRASLVKSSSPPSMPSPPISRAPSSKSIAEGIPPPRPSFSAHSRASSIASVGSGMSDYGRAFDFEQSSQGHEDGRRSSSSIGHVRPLSPPVKSRPFAGALSGKPRNSSVPSLSLSRRQSTESGSGLATPVTSTSTAFPRINGLVEQYHDEEDVGDLGKQSMGSHSRQSSKSKSGWLGSLRVGKEKKGTSFLSFDSEGSAPSSPVVGPVLVVPHTLAVPSSGGKNAPESPKATGGVRRFFRTLSNVGKRPSMAG